MPLLATLGLHFDDYGQGWAEATWLPTESACNPFGIVHGGVYGVVHDAAMNFATSSALESGDRCATLEVGYTTMRPSRAGATLHVRSSVVRVATGIAWVECAIRDDEDVVSKGHATFSLRRKER
jgi:uncharacterized protein (TIGR00369 family)